MPIGKNAIKRVTNNGYSKVKAEAPDMENSTVIEKEPEVAQPKKSVAKRVTSAPKADASNKKTSSTKKTTAQKATTVTPKKSMEKEPDFSPVKTAEKVVNKDSAEKRQGNGYVNLGGELPIHLL